MVQENEQRGITHTANSFQLGSDRREGRKGGREGGREGTENSAQRTIDEVERHVIWLVQEHLQQFDDPSNGISANANRFILRLS